MPHGKTANTDEIRLRIKASKAKGIFNEKLDCCWGGYLAALMEWGMISASDHASLLEEIKISEPNPTLEIFLGEHVDKYYD